MDLSRNPAYQAYQTLRFTFTFLPFAVGADKLLQIMANWEQYLAPFVPRMLHVSGHTLMRISGTLELAVAAGMVFKPRVFSYVVCAWLLGIVTNLLLTGHYFDIALRDFALFLASLAFARLCPMFDPKSLSDRQDSLHRLGMPRKRT